MFVNVLNPPEQRTLLALLRRELGIAATWRFLLLWAIVAIAPVAYTMVVQVDQYALVDNLDLYTLMMSGALPGLFPLLVVCVFAARFSGELRNRYVVYTRTRVSVRRYLLAKAIANAVLCFFVLFAVAFIPFLFAFEIQPALELIEFTPENRGMTASELAAGLPERGTFTQLFSAGSWAYGLGYAAWVGLSGALYATLAFLLVLTVRNSFVALSIPFIGYHLASFVVAVARLESFSPVFTIFPFSLTQQPLWTVLVPLAVMAAGTGVLGVYIARTVETSDVLT